MNLELVEFGTTPTQPQSLPPSADASYEERAAWSDQYVTWLIAQTPQEGRLPTDVHATHRYEVEFISCVDDPEAYERETREELTRSVH